MKVELITSIRRDLSRLSRFGANIADAHSCFIFIPSWIMQSASAAGATPDISGRSAASQMLELGGYHSLSNEIVKNCRLVVDNGLIGWVAKHRRSIHVSPFDRDSRTLGIYSEDQSLKSFIGVPIPLDDQKSSSHGAIAGVVTCDSRKSYAFSKLQGKLIENLADEITNTIRLNLNTSVEQRDESCWKEFMRRAGKLLGVAGNDGIEALRLRLMNFDALEAHSGLPQTAQFIEQVYRLIQQSLPPLTPYFRLPNGDLVLLMDTMMGAFYENKIMAICEHVRCNGIKSAFECRRRVFVPSKGKLDNVETLIAKLCQYEESRSKEAYYEYGRA